MAAAAAAGSGRRVLSFPVLAVLSLIGFVYYSTLFVFLDQRVVVGGLRGPTCMLNAVPFTFLAFMCLVSFLAAVFVDPGHVPPSFSPEIEDPPQKTGMQPKHCDRCCTYKPPRAHHCRVCKRCVLKMDHHCLWINNCVGYRNYKPFIIFVLYASVASIYSTVIFLGSITHSDRSLALPHMFFYEEPQRSTSIAGLPSHPAMSCRAFNDVANTEYMPQRTQLFQRSRSPSLTHYVESNLPASASCSNLADDSSNIAAGMSALSLSKTRSLNEENVVHCQFPQQFTSHSELSFDIPQQREHYLHQSNMGKPNKEFCNSPPLSITASEELYRTNGSQSQFVKNIPRFPANGQTHLVDRSSSNNVYSKLHTSQPGSVGRSTLSHISEADFGWSNMNGYLVNQRLPGNINNQLDAGASFRGSMEAQYLARGASLSGSGPQVPLMNSPYSQYLQGLQLGAQSTRNIDDPEERDFRHIPSVHAKYRKALIESFLEQQKLQHGGAPFSGIPGLNRNAALGLPSPYPTSFISSLSSENYLRQSERLARFPSSGKYPNRGFLGSCTTESGKTNFNSSLLEVYRGNNNIRIELSDIMDCIVELSSDQYGSRFIQQKLENASSEEKNKVFPTIFPYALELMTDVFGNYVIQKFFEKGSKSQRGQLATQITGHVLPLSLQMYGCRVIQKALELLDEDQQTQMVSELDGSVMKCVRDQNGNHVIQKCIECVPKERTEFIISSIYGQVASLSTHPYGCRVIQRILERFHDGQTKSKMMSEILQSACALAQDQYGNYVIQHVLQHGEQSGRSAIIKELSGEIVKMSQQKYASNVVEKCLIVANPVERQFLIDEILGCSEGNESLQVMMKDQYANYVVQRVLETCDDRNRQLILSLIRVHLNSLKRHTFVKHIIARVEKLITAGERHMKISSGLWGGMEQFS